MRGSTPSIGRPSLRPSNDIVTASSRRSIEPPTQAPGRSKLSPLAGGETAHSSGWISGQW